MGIGSRTRKLIAITGMFLLSLALMALGSRMQSPTRRPFLRLASIGFTIG